VKGLFLIGVLWEGRALRTLGHQFCEGRLRAPLRARHPAEVLLLASGALGCTSFRFFPLAQALQALGFAPALPFVSSSSENQISFMEHAFKGGPRDK
jgi:hypothetical protein